MLILFEKKSLQWVILMSLVYILIKLGEYIDK
jgi:hypothetical protein